ELGVKEVWKVKKPLDRTIHTMGWPLRTAAKYREFGGSLVYPMGEDMLTVGIVVGLDYRDAELSVHDLLQELKTHPMLRRMLEGGERLEWGAKTIPSGGYYSLPTKLHAPGLLLCGDGPGLVSIPTLKGIHYAVESGRLAAEAAFASLKAAPVTTRALASYDETLRASFVWHDLYRVRDMRQVFGHGFFMGGALASLMEITNGKLSLGKMPTEPDDSQRLLSTGRAKRYPEADGTLTFDKLSSVYASGNKSRDDQPNHIRLAEKVPIEVAQMWSHLCPAHVYDVGSKAEDGLVTVHVAPSNCVQCGAISARGGRLTPPEGSSGPEYQLT
ncbi:MAG: 4Fe-4S dicluster domain-containing protein, partial [Nitrososphaerales archaeon]